MDRLFLLPAQPIGRKIPQGHWYPDLEMKYHLMKQPYCQSLQLHEVVMNSASKYR